MRGTAYYILMKRVQTLIGVTAIAITFAVGLPVNRADAGMSSKKMTLESSTFSIAIIPDTQQEVFGKDRRFSNRTQWLVDNKEELNLKYVLHTGDLVNWDTPDHAQYAVASDAMSILDRAGIPWSGAIGNHDTAAVCEGGSACDSKRTRQLVRLTTTYNKYFPLSRFPQVGGKFEDTKVDNAWSTFNAGGENWLVMSLELWPRSTVLTWAAGVIQNHPSFNVIISTHSYLEADGSIGQSGSYGESSPQQIYERLVKPYDNVKLVFSGHVGEAGSRVDIRPDGTKIASFLGTFHSNSTNPVQLITVDTRSGTVSSRFFGPWDGSAWPKYSKRVSGMSWASGSQVVPWISLRAAANGQLVAAEGAGAWPLIANRSVVGQWEQFAIEYLDGDDIALRSRVNSMYVCSESGGASPLVANRRDVGPWETFDLIKNSDGSVSLRSHANGLYVTAEAAGLQPLIANRIAIGPWEKFELN